MFFFKNLLQKINSLVEYIVCVLLTVMVVVVFLQVIFRFVLHSSLPWSEELSRYLMIWIVFLGASIGINKKSHIGVEALVILLPAVLQKWAAVAVNALCCVFFAFMIQYGGLILRVVGNQLSPAMEVSMAVPYGALLAGGVLMFAHCFFQMIEQAADALSARAVKGS
jgi:C4-dicarboxylate transporter DctQ subunit